jgi:hypothetical protein
MGSFGYSSFSRLPFYPSTRECFNVMECLRCLALILGSRNKLASLDYAKVASHKVQYLPPLYNGDVFFELLPRVSPLLLLKTIRIVRISGSMVTHGAIP